ncbi:enoyl-CoA-hydratase DpgB [Marinactinospora rubrisoli]|uniref:Enoyl-CoA-hydratase DpgB n=1 Tax=Marinactinospora rubrisoli TaxID=2715399 RepID=A0ABW2KCF2_9ACTN
MDTMPGVAGRVGVRIGADRPLSASLVAEVEDCCARAEDSGGPVVLYAAGTPAGADVPEWPGDVEIHLVGKWERALRRVERLGAATVAVADGFCTGPALEALLVADHRVATPEATFGLPLGAGGAWPGMVVHRLAGRLGGRARGLVLFGDRLGAAEAHAAGLVDEVADDVAERVAAVTRSLEGVAGPELAIRRRLLLDAATTGFEEALGAHLASCDRELRRERARAGLPATAP